MSDNIARNMLSSQVTME